MTPLTTLLEQAGVLVFVAAGVFARVGAALFLVPGFGERAVPMRLRLGAALALTALLTPLLAPALQAPATPAGLVRMILAEAAAGLIIGLGFRYLIFALQVAGTVAAQNVSLSQMFGAGVAPEPEPTIATLLAMAGIVLALLAGLHVHLVAALAGLYRVLPFGEMPGPVRGSPGRWRGSPSPSGSACRWRCPSSRSASPTTWRSARSAGRCRSSWWRWSARRC